MAAKNLWDKTAPLFSAQALTWLPPAGLPRGLSQAALPSQPISPSEWPGPAVCLQYPPNSSGRQCGRRLPASPTMASPEPSLALLSAAPGPFTLTAGPQTHRPARTLGQQPQTCGTSPSHQPPHVAENGHGSRLPPCPAPSLSQKAPGVSISAGNLSFSRRAGGPAAYPRRGALRRLRLVQAERGCPGCPAMAASLKEEKAMGGGGRG